MGLFNCLCLCEKKLKSVDKVVKRQAEIEVTSTRHQRADLTNLLDLVAFQCVRIRVRNKSTSLTDLY